MPSFPPLICSHGRIPLNRRLEWECTNGTIPGLKIAQGVKRINHSQFVDDTILLSGASKVMERRIKQVMDISSQLLEVY
jgi:hypothetical protein